MLKSLDGVLQRVPGCKSHREWALSVHLQDETFETHPAGEKTNCAPVHPGRRGQVVESKGRQTID